MVAHANKGKRVLRLKGGDPFYLWQRGRRTEYLFKHNVKFEIVPGLRRLSDPLICRNPIDAPTFLFVSSDSYWARRPSKNEPSVNWSELAFAVDTLVVLMGIEQLSRIVGILINSGMKKSYRGSNYRKWNYQKAERNNREFG